MILLYWAEEKQEKVLGACMMNSKKVLSLTFEDILKQEEYIIWDSAVISSPDTNWYHKMVYDSVSFLGINLETLGKEAEFLKYFLPFLENPNVFTVLGVALEIDRTRKIVADKIKFLKERERFLGKREFEGKGEAQKELLEGIRDLFYEYYKELRKSLFIPQQKQIYHTLEEITIKVTEQTNSKIDYSRYYEKRVKPKRDPGFHADEQTVAAALYLSSIEGKKGGILTRDSDIERILKNTLNCRFLSGISDLITNNRIKIYYPTGVGKAHCRFNTTDFVYHENMG